MDYSTLIGQPAIDAPEDVPIWHDGRRMKEVILVCPECGVAGLYLEPPPDTTARFGDKTDECEDCGFGLD